MANHKSAKKATRQIAKRTEINRNRISRVRTFIKKLEATIATGVAADALAAFRLAEKEISRGAQKGVLHRNTASRTVSRLSKRVKALSAA